MRSEAPLATLVVGCASSPPPTPSVAPADRQAAVAPLGAPTNPSSAAKPPARRPRTAEDDRRPHDWILRQEAAHPESKYLEAPHRRMHPIFTDAFLSSLDSLPATDPINNPKLVTKVEIVLTPNGELRRTVIVETSGVAAFDAGALDAVGRAAPFGPAPTAIAARDGNVHIVWGFHRDGVYGCSTMNARLVPP
jgi:TonB family protein